MRAAVVYESMFGNTAEVAGAIAVGMREKGMDEVHLVDVRDHRAYELATYDVVVVGAPTHGLTLSRPSTRRGAVAQGADASHVRWGVREWLNTLRDGRCVPLMATFDTKAHGMRFLPGSAARATARILQHAGTTMLLPPTSFYVEGTRGPLCPDETDRARDWGGRLAGLVRERLVGEMSA